LRVANAGQTQPIVYKAGRCEQIKLAGFPFGIFDDATYDELSITLEPGDILVFHSDGLSEAPDPNGNLFGVSRLCSLIEVNASAGASELVDKVFAAVQAFTRGEPVTDDRALIVMKVL
jgi:sigma-B regulation protein RsbU (phosphoserine phosphatase)